MWVSVSQLKDFFVKLPPPMGFGYNYFTTDEELMERIREFCAAPTMPVLQCKYTPVDACHITLRQMHSTFPLTKVAKSTFRMLLSLVPSA